MANACEVFGDIVPNIYIDRIFLEESRTDTDNDGRVDQETPEITVTLKVLDQLSDKGTYALLGDALEYKGVNFKEFVKVHCVLFTSEEGANNWITEFEDDNYTNTYDYFNYPDNRNYHYDTIKTLQDFGSTYINQDGITEMITSFSFSLATNGTLDYLRVFCWTEIDTESMGQEFGVDFPNEYKNLLSRYQDQLVINKSVLTPELTILVTEDGDYWDGPFHIHHPGRVYMVGRTHINEPHDYLRKISVPINNVQDFRIRDEIEVLVANFTDVVENQYLFPEQKQMLDREFSKNSYFSEIMITKDVDRNARFFFAFDYGKYVLQNSKYSNLISRMSDDVKENIINNSEIVKFVVGRKQVKEMPAKNRLGSPVQNFALSDAAIEAPVILSLDDPNLTEIDLLLTEQTTVPDSLLRYFTGIDRSMSAETDGFFQYFVEIGILDGFIPIMKEVYTNLIVAASNYEEYVALTQIPGVYDSKSRKFTVAGQEVFSDFFGERGGSLNYAQAAVQEYLNALSYFVDLSTPLNATETISKKEYFSGHINNILDPTTGGVDGVIFFQKLLNTLISQMAKIASAGHSGGGVEDSVANQPAGASSLYQLQTSTAKEIFDNTIGARFINESYVDNVNNVGVSAHSGLTIYTQTQLANRQELEENLNLEAPINQTPEEVLGNFGISFRVQPVTIANIGPAMARNRASSFIGQGQGSVAVAASASYNTLPNQSLFTPEPSVNTEAAFAPFVSQLSQMTPSNFLVQEQEVTADQLQTDIEVLVGFVVPSGMRGMRRTSSGQQYVGPSSLSFMIREARFVRKTLGDLVLNVPTNSYYLCRQIRRSDVEVVDSYFLVTPGSTNTFATSINPQLALQGQEQANFVDVADSVLRAGGPGQDLLVSQQLAPQTQTAPAVARAIQQARSGGNLLASQQTAPQTTQQTQTTETEAQRSVRRAIRRTGPGTGGY